MVIGKVLNKIAKDKREKIVASFQDQEITYYELEVKSNQLANGLIDLGINVENMVSILLPNSIEFLISYFGVIKSA
ncbi:AMP-binding protein [Selenihalanaerobacter shriftii]|uniref:AMP-binding enzyme n=1 Tax=Selenihalanaerobacter shriftii TaxID=142842 RepID=A0A1T4L926_9FIRM|nr:AMP-binding protein [Selenihalanaerobacter shriftii]SJZ51255.1 AMP-binding enzyme [Selenihalanaerobacter shriftii]